jgi:hypothetical protein
MTKKPAGKPAGRSAKKEAAGKRLLLHACCAPCALHPVQELAQDWQVTLYYVNPNVHPRWEWAKRRDQLIGFFKSAGFKVASVDYEPHSWSSRVLSGSADLRPERCRRCYALRLDATAAYASKHGFDAFSSTLLVSPYQDHGGVIEAGNAAADLHHIPFVARDFREGYKWGVGRSKQLRMYRQNYCGCVLSLIERGQRQRRAERLIAAE